jgi:hypothetical protein
MPLEQALVRVCGYLFFDARIPIVVMEHAKGFAGCGIFIAPLWKLNVGRIDMGVGVVGDAPYTRGFFVVRGLISIKNKGIS